MMAPFKGKVLPIAKKMVDKKNPNRLTPEAAEFDLIKQAISMGQTDPRDMPGANRAERRAFAARVRQTMAMLSSDPEQSHASQS